MIRGISLGVCLLTGIALFTWRGRSLLGERVPPSRTPLSVESVETIADNGGLLLNVTVHNNELYHMVAAVDCEADDDAPSPCTATTTPLLSPGGRATVRLSLTASPILGDAVTVRARESIDNIAPSDPEWSRLSPVHRFRVDLR